MLSHARLCDPTDWSPPGSSVHGMSQARVQEWVAIALSRGLPNPSPLHWLVGFFTTAPPGKPIYTLPGVNQMARGKLLHSTGNSAQGSVMIWRGRMGEGWEGSPRGRGYMSTGSVAIGQKLTQHSKTIIFQLKKKKELPTSLCDPSSWPPLNLSSVFIACNRLWTVRINRIICGFKK